MTSDQYKMVATMCVMVGACWIFALAIAALLIGWEKSTKGAWWRYFDR